MITDLDLADWALAAYARPATIETDDAHALIGAANGVQVIAMRGTDPTHFIDLIRDAEAVGLRNDPIFGPVSASFIEDAEEIVWRLWPLLADPFAITGHSKGGDDAQGVGAILTRMGRPPIRLSVFEPAQLGRLNGTLDPIPGIATRHGEDEITQFPLDRGHAQRLVELPWTGGLVLNPLDYHAMAGVRAAVAAMRA